MILAAIPIYMIIGIIYGSFWLDRHYNGDDLPGLVLRLALFALAWPFFVLVNWLADQP